MLTRKTRMASLVAIAAAVMLALSTNVANAAQASGTRWCTQKQVGVAYAYVSGSGSFLPPGNSQWRGFTLRPGVGQVIERSANVVGGGNWIIKSSRDLQNSGAYCMNGLP